MHSPIRQSVALALLFFASLAQARVAFPWEVPAGLGLIPTVLIMSIVLLGGYLAEAFFWSRKPSGVASPLTLAIWTPLLLALFVLLTYGIANALYTGEIIDMPSRRHHGPVQHVNLRSNSMDFWMSFLIYAFLATTVEAGVIRCGKAWLRVWRQWRRHIA